MPTFDEALRSEPLHHAKLDNKHRGELAELAFMRKAASLGFAVAKPWGDSDRYDVVVRVGKIFWRVQVKSVWGKLPEWRSYRAKAVNSAHLPYTVDEIDFLVTYIFSEDIWYIFPATEVQGRRSICMTPGSKRSKNERYREAWRLMKPEPVCVALAAANASAPPVAEATDAPS